MKEEEVKAQFAKYEPQYISFKDEVISFLEDLRNKHAKSVEIYSITGRVKTIASIIGKVSQDEGKFTKITNIQDISGTRVVCHCRSDLDRFDTILTEQLEITYPEIKRTAHTREDGYRGVHYVIKKKFVFDRKEETFKCEVQLRTVLQDAWAIQSHVFGYKKKVEGDADILKQAMSGILDNCETLWELVKRDARGGRDAAADEITMIYQNTAEKVATVNRSEEMPDTEKIVSTNKLTEIEDELNVQFKKIKENWTGLHSAGYSHDNAAEILEKLEVMMAGITVIGLLAIKHDKLDALKKVFHTLEKVSNLAEGMSGLTNILSIPAALLHNSFYYFGIYAVQKLNGKIVDYIISEQIEKDHNGRIFYSRIWERGSYMAPEIVHGAEKMFNRLIAEYPKNETVRNIISANEDDFLNLAVTFNMLFCMKAAKETEDGKQQSWAYPNFGRFYGSRLYRFIERVKHRTEYQEFISKAIKEDVKSFGEKFDLRIGKMEERGLGGGFWWEADVRWNE
jgi:ppGpp synthetase/RelA/SpoT-type nucleotidyltranferase